VNRQTLIDEAISLPVEERALVVDSILRSLNPTDSRIDREWAQVARERLDDLRSGKVSGIPADDVFRRVRERLAR
jgi:putative addiction module component (TIGR02574 family)